MTKSNLATNNLKEFEDINYLFIKKDFFRKGVVVKYMVKHDFKTCQAFF